MKQKLNQLHIYFGLLLSNLHRVVLKKSNYYMTIYLPWLLAHFIGDYLLQNDWMAVGKKKSSFICTVHVTFYILPFLLSGLSFTVILLIYIQHWIQDRTTFVAWWCKTTGSFQSELKMPCLPYGHFIVDNIFHVIWMWGVINFIK